MESATHYRNGRSKAKNPRKIKYDPDWLRKNVRESKALSKFLRGRIDFKDSSRDLYISHMTTYCYFLQETIDDLVAKYKKDQKELSKDEDADEEDLQVFIDLTEYAQHAATNRQAKSTIQGKVKRVKAFLKKNGITIPYIDIRLQTYDDSEGYFTKKDLPDKETMQTIITNANPKHTAMYAWVYTTGSGRAETANVKVKDILDSLEEFCDSSDPRMMIKELQGKCAEKEVVPVVKMKRQKTGKPYYTVTTPECIELIISYINTDLSILDNPNGRLFSIQAGAVGNAFKDTNLKYGFGKRGRYNFFGCHRLRHNHYTQINNPNLANALEGRVVKDKITKHYDHNLDDPEYLREQYKDHMHKFEIFDHYDVAIRDEEVKKLQEENKKLKDQLEKTNKAVEDLGQKIDDSRTNIPFHKVHNAIINYLSDIGELDNDRASLLNLMVFDHVKNHPTEYKDTDEYLLDLVRQLDIQIELSNKDIAQQHQDLTEKIDFNKIDPIFIMFLDELLNIIKNNEGVMKRIADINIDKFDYVAEEYLISSGIIPDITKVDLTNITEDEKNKIAGEILIKYLKT